MDSMVVTLSNNDENVLVKQIQATHSPDGRVIDSRPLLYYVDDNLNRATLNPDAHALITTTGTQESQFQDAFLHAQSSLIIDRISSEISYKALSDKDAHQTSTLSIFHQLSNYDWDTKMLLVVAAFALRYGEFWLLVQIIYSTNQVIGLSSEHASALKPRFHALNDLIKTILEVTHCAVKIKELPSRSVYITPDVPALSTGIAHFPTAAYWTIRSIVACATLITSFTSTGYEFVISATEAQWDQLSTLAHKLKNMRDHLNKQLEKCHQHINEKLEDEYFDMLAKLFEMVHLDNMKVIRALICPKDDVLPLIDGSTKRRVSIDVLRRQNVLLLISGVNISEYELSILEQMYNESRFHPTRPESRYELVWIPIVDPSSQTDTTQNKFESLQSIMPWYKVQHPSLIRKAVVRFIKEKWHFKNKLILVVLDPQGNVVSPNAIHMMWIWGSLAFPFTSSREEALWRGETWGLELLVDGIDPTILNWIREGKYIFLYGGDDIQWIRKFTNSARTVAMAAGIPLEMLYVGKGSKMEQVQQIIKTITLEKLSSCWQDQILIWFFWTRIESMLFSMNQVQDKVDDHLDPVMQGIKSLLSYDSEGGWVLLSKGYNIVMNGHGATVVTTLVEYEMWKENMAVQGFDVAFKTHHDLRQGEKYPPDATSSSHTMHE